MAPWVPSKKVCVQGFLATGWAGQAGFAEAVYGKSWESKFFAA